MAVLDKIVTKKTYNTRSIEPKSYVDPNIQYLNENVPEGMTFPALSAVPKEYLRDPNETLPGDRSPIDWSMSSETGGNEPSTDERNQRALVRDYLEQKYSQVADRSGVDKALENQKYENQWANAGHNIDRMLMAHSAARGGPGADAAYWQGQKKAAAVAVDDQESMRQAKIKDYLMKQKLGSEGVDELQQMHDYDRKNAGILDPKTEAEIALLGAREATTRAGKSGRAAGTTASGVASGETKMGIQRGLEYKDGIVMSDNNGNFYDMNRKPILDVNNIKEVDPTQKKAMTESQAKALSFWERADRANSSFDSLEADKGYKLPSSGTRQVAIDTYLQSSGMTRMLAKKLLTPEDMEFANASMGFLNAILRQDSGASIPETEYAKYKPMLPEYGDTDEILEKKRAERESIIKSLGMVAGDRYTEELTKRRSNVPAPKFPENLAPYSPDVVKALEFVKNPKNRNDENYSAVLQTLKRKGVIK